MPLIGPDAIEIPPRSILTLQVIPLSALAYHPFYRGLEADKKDEFPEPGYYDELEGAMQRTEDVEPLIVTKEADGHYMVEDGNHRLEIAHRLGMTEFPAYVYDPNASKQSVGSTREAMAEQTGVCVMEVVRD